MGSRVRADPDSQDIVCQPMYLVMLESCRAEKMILLYTSFLSTCLGDIEMCPIFSRIYCNCGLISLSKRPSINSLIHFIKRCVSSCFNIEPAQVEPSLFRTNDSPLLDQCKSHHLYNLNCAALKRAEKLNPDIHNILLLQEP